MEKERKEKGREWLVASKSIHMTQYNIKCFLSSYSRGGPWKNRRRNLKRHLLLCDKFRFGFNSWSFLWVPTRYGVWIHAHPQGCFHGLQMLGLCGIPSRASLLTRPPHRSRKLFLLERLSVNTVLPFRSHTRKTRSKPHTRLHFPKARTNFWCPMSWRRLISSNCNHTRLFKSLLRAAERECWVFVAFGRQLV